MSAGTQVGAGILPVGKHLVPANIPPWLRNVVERGPEVTSFLLGAYREIEDLEHTRAREAIRDPTRTHPYSITVAQLPQNHRRNRYYDIIPYDRSRVVLATPSPVDGSDYINASHFRGLAGTRPYIVSQGPMPHTCGDFWQMIWEQNTGLIVMLTKEEERGRTKCHPYVPSTNDGPVTYPNLGGLTVTLLEQDTMPNDDVLLRRVSLAKPSANGADETRSVWQLHYLAWPDHRASSPQSVLAVMDLARHLQGLAEKKDPACGPMLVHCSAGCGRTGTFCAIDSVLQLLERPRGPPTDVPLDPHGDADIVRLTVEAFREHRVSAVQTVEQYAFCYEAVLYRLLEWQHDVSGTRPDWVVLAPTSAGDTGVDVGVGSTGVKADSSSALVTDTSI